MTLIEEIIELLPSIRNRLTVPLIERIFIPAYSECPDKPGEFMALGLADGSIGLAFTLLDDALRDLQDGAATSAIGEDPLDLIGQLDWDKPRDRVVVMACINAVSQWLFRASGHGFDFSSDSVAQLGLSVGDRVGMVGYFPPLVAQLRAQKIPLTVLELKAELLREEQGFRVTLDPRRLEDCNKVLCTSTVLLNDTLRGILSHCRQARVAVIGPGAGLLPDSLFRQGVDTVGGIMIEDSEAFWTCCGAGESWGWTGRKYCIRKAEYPGFAKLLSDALTRCAV